MIIFDKVSKSYEHEGKQVVAVEEVDLAIREKEIFGIIGESGSGKSTLLKLIQGLERADRGSVRVDGVDVFAGTEAEKRYRRRRIGMVFQQFNLLGNRTVEENVGLPLKLMGQKDPERVKEVLRFVRLSEKAGRYPKQLSGGEKQRAAIARALVTSPNLLLCDEPTSALDGQHAYEVMELLKMVNQTFGTTIVIVSHELELIRELCQRTAIIEKGRLLETLTLKPLKSSTAFPSYYERIKEQLT